MKTKKIYLPSGYFVKVITYKTKKELRLKAQEFSNCAYYSVAKDEAFCWQKPKSEIRKCFAEIYLHAKNPPAVIVHELFHAVSHYLRTFPEKLDVYGWEAAGVDSSLSREETGALLLEHLYGEMFN